MRLLAVEDDPLIGRAVVNGLREGGYAVDWVRDGAAAELALSTTQYDLVVLDLGLPRKDGLELLRGLRRAGNDVPVLIITARDGLADRVTGLDLGADDYLAKPFRIEELVARVRALARRSRNQILTAADLTVDTLRRTADRGGRALYLSPTEFSVLQLLLERQGQPVSKKDILAYVWRDDATRDPNTVEVYVNYLRNKLEAGGAPRLIHTQRGAGYVLSSQEPDES